jgi:hypothetical protein
LESVEDAGARDNSFHPPVAALRDISRIAFGNERTTFYAAYAGNAMSGVLHENGQ